MHVPISTSFIRWIDSYFRHHGLCPEGVEVCKKAVSFSSSLTGVGNVFALVGAPFFGILAHKYHRLVSVMVASIMGIIGYCSFAALG